MQLETLNLTEQEWFDLYIDHALGKRSDVIPFPGENLQCLTNSKKGLDTAKGAIEIWRTIKEGAESVKPIDREWKVLDYGCGWGRMTRLLPFYFEPKNIFGVDVVEEFVQSANQLMPSIVHKTIKSMQPIPFQAESFDLIFANSVFSHLSEKSARYTVEELVRILKPGGVIVLSVLEQPELEKFYKTEEQKKWITGILGNLDDAVERLNTGSGFIWGDTKRWDNYGITVMKSEWMENLYHENGLLYKGSFRSSLPGSQNYKVGLKADKNISEGESNKDKTSQFTISETFDVLKERLWEEAPNLDERAFDELLISFHKMYDELKNIAFDPRNKHTRQEFEEGWAAQSVQFAIDSIPEIHRIMKVHYKRSDDLTLLDVGAGSGAGTNIFTMLHSGRDIYSKIRVEAIDYTNSRLRWVKTMYPKINYKVADVYDLPRKNWDLVFCSHVIEHVQNPRKFLEKLVEICKGYLFVYSPYNEVDRIPAHINTITEKLYDGLAVEKFNIMKSMGWHAGRPEGMCLLAVVDCTTN